MVKKKRRSYFARKFDVHIYAHMPVNKRHIKKSPGKTIKKKYKKHIKKKSPITLTLKRSNTTSTYNFRQYEDVSVKKLIHSSFRWM